MPIDAYAPCPGGLDKKVKFCCSDLTTELEKLSRMIEGDQRVAALDYIDKLEAKFADRACLLSIKSALLAAGDREEELQATLKRFLKAHPQNPVALAESAVATAAEKSLEAGVGQLQDALEHVETNIPRQVYDAIGAIAVVGLQTGRPISALAHLTLQSALDRKDENVINMLGRVMSSPNIPLLMKDERRIGPAPADAPWKSAYDDALREANRGRWRRAATWLFVIASKHANPPQVWQTIASLRAWLADNRGAVEALRKVASLDIPFDDAVEAEALAQLLEPAENEKLVDVLSIEYPIRDFERLMELLVSSDNAAAIPFDRHQHDENDVPPRAAFVVLDRAKPRSGADLTLDTVPRVLGTVMVYGKQTDRDARVELITYRTDEEAAARNALLAIAGETLAEAGEPETVEHVHPVRHALAANWHLPEDTPQERIRALSQEHRQKSLFERWPGLPLPILDGKTAIEVKDDAKYRLKLAALVLLLELSAEQEGAEVDLNDLRAQLGLPATTPIDPARVDLRDVPVARYGQLEIAKLSDEQLASVFQTTAGMGLRRILKTVAEEMLKRPSLQGKVDLGGVYRTLAMLATEPEDALRWLHQGRDWAESQGQSSAIWDLEELSLQLSRMEAQEATRLIEHIMRNHINEPGVRQSLTELLYSAGIIGPDGRPARPLPGEGPAVAPQQAPAKPGGIWTPESAAGEGAKSKLWVPGMD